MSDLIVEIFTDGACSGNPGPGGWGALLRAGERQRQISGGEPSTTNNRMELTAAIKALEALHGRRRVRLVTDSTYLRDGITRWIDKWRGNGWKTSKRAPVKNADLWQALDTAASCHQIDWVWVKGHSGHAENELADHLAREALEQLKNSRAQQ